MLLDLSVAFDTVDHSVLLHRLQTSFGISGALLDWFKSYLSARCRRVSIPTTLSDSLSLDWGVPQGSCLGPLLYIIYTSKLFNIIECHLPNSHCCGDDLQIYLSFEPDDLSSQQDAITVMQTCTDDICSWMEHDKLLLYDEKTKFLVIGNWQHTKWNCTLLGTLACTLMTSCQWTPTSIKSVMHHFTIFTTLAWLLREFDSRICLQPVRLL